MGTTDGRSRLLAALEESLCHDPDVEFAVAFGSQVAGNARRSSDLDVAVKFSDELSSQGRFRKRCFLSVGLQREGAPFVDIADIPELPLAVAHDAVNGDLLCGDERSFHEFETDIDTEFEQRRDDIRRHQQTVISRATRGKRRFAFSAERR